MQHETTDIFARITGQILQALRKGPEKFRMALARDGGGLCFTRANVVRGRPYRGIKRPGSLGCHGVAGLRGVSGALTTSGRSSAQVRKGRRPLPCLLENLGWPQGNYREGDEPVEWASSRAVLAKGYSVFNVAQVRGRHCA